VGGGRSIDGRAVEVHRQPDVETDRQAGGTQTWWDLRKENKYAFIRVTSYNNVPHTLVILLILLLVGSLR